MFEFLRNVFIVGSIVLFIATLVTYFRAKPRSWGVVQLKSGSLGSGKTYLSVSEVLKRYKKLRKKVKKQNRSLFKKKNPFHVKVYSNIPLYLGHGEYSEVLTREHILLIDPFPDDVIPLVLWDEVGLSANQYSFDDPNISSRNINDDFRCVETFIRLFRQFYGENSGDACRIFATDQASGDVCIALRRRFGFVDNLSNFRRWLGFMPFYKVNVSTLMVQEDSVINTNNVKKEKDEKQDYYFGFFPYRWMSKIPRYDSHCFSGVKYTGFSRKLNFSNWKYNDYSYIDGDGALHVDALKTNYCPDLRMSDVELAEYKARLALIQKLTKDRIFSDEKDIILQEG